MDIRKLVLAILNVYTWLIFVRVILSWVNPMPRNEILRGVIAVTEPVLAPLRRLIPMGGLDFSPLVAFLLLRLLMRLVLGSSW
ncbi:MAG TPA: YggT family protein [Candidatus Krumholzibacteria bacterium]|nr:YggT family protein [Candidatus Krumholzibacteria bacterium]